MTALPPLLQVERYLRSVHLLQQPGTALYSGEETLAEGPVYLLGLNPGGSEKANLEESIAAARKGRNCYLDESWSPGGRARPAGQALLQRRVQYLCERMGRRTRQVPASNLALTRSRRVDAHIDFIGDVRRCLPVHRIFLNAIRPDFLMTFGSLDNFKAVSHIEQVETRAADHGRWKAHRGRVQIAGRSMAFGNVPHLSFWAIDKRSHILDWVLERCPSRG